ncbi:MAG: DUF4453 domain-containing protein [Pseudomonadota bacterium]
MTRALRAAIVAAMMAVATPAAAQDFCTEAWVIRNMIFDRLGHCFGSVMGQALFDNSNCTVSGPTPPPSLAEDVARLRDGESFVGCQINTSQQPSPEMYRLHAHYARFSDLPVPDHVGGYACWGYRGPDFRLLSGANVNAPEMGIARTGQSVVTTYWGRPGGWVYGAIMTGPGGTVLTEGWFAGVDLSDGNCDQVAG